MDEEIGEGIGEEEGVTNSLRILSLYGDIEEEKCSEIISGLRILHHSFTNGTDEGDREQFELLVSSAGGSASDMFAIYDTMRMVREDCDIKTRGLGKVMSAAVLLLAAGTKGKRLVGKNCRLMIHSVVSGHAGELYSLQNELEEVQWVQNQYVKALANETDMTQKYIKKLLNRRVNVYLTAEEAVEHGIADEVF